jgi:hypothetical protein
MQPTSYSKLMVQETSLKAITHLYCDWVLGVQDFKEKRQARLQSGIPSDLSAVDLELGGDHGTDERARIRTRLDDKDRKWLLHWTHLDVSRDDVTWHNIVRIEETKLGVSTEHLVGRVFPPEFTPYPVWERPAVISRLVDKFGNRLLPRDLFKDSAIRINVGEVEDFVKWSLLDRKRTVPVVLLSPRNNVGDFLIDPDFLAKRLVGMTPVVCLTEPAACWELEEVLKGLNFHRSLGCYDGAVRLYRPNLKTVSDPYDHPLWTANRILTTPLRWRGRTVLGQIGEALSHQVSTHSWLSIIEDIDLAKWRSSAEALLKSERSPEIQDTKDLMELRGAIEQRNREISELRAKLEEAVRRVKEAEDMQNYFSEEHNQAISQNENLREKINDLEERSRLLGYQDIKTPEDALTLAKRVFSDRVIIAQSAFENAKKCYYRRPKEIFDVLSILALSGRDAFNVTQVVKSLMGNRADNKNKDSEQTVGTFGNERKFKSATGEKKLYKKHVTLGGGMGRETHIQLYYDYLPDGKVEIVYAGEHLPTFGKDT